MSEATDFIREWNRAAIIRNGGVVITPRGQITAETAEHIRLAEDAGQRVTYVTSRPDRRPARSARRPVEAEPLPDYAPDAQPDLFSAPARQRKEAA
ncbi:hypothetical protein [Actinomadura sp. NPDC000929]|uniref:hypothetical protein n=1 Tax=Actinomadura sp. NPDC000929 TaxID=3154517 RepID=UPI003393C930